MALPLGRLTRERPESEDTMLKTALCEVLGIEVPIILAAMGGTASSGEFAAAVSNQGGLGSIGLLFRSTAAVTRDIDVARELTNRNFTVNHIPPTLELTRSATL